MAPILTRLMILLNNFIPCFRQKRTFRYLVAFFKGFILNGRKTVTRIFTNSDDDRHWTNFYRFLKKYKWEADSLFEKLCSIAAEKMKAATRKTKMLSENVFGVLDPTYAEKSGKKFDGSGLFFDHSAEKYIWGHCIFIQGLLIPLATGNWTAIPVQASIFIRKATLEKEGREEEFETMIEKAVNMTKQLSEQVSKPLTMVADAFFYKKKFFAKLYESGIFVLTRCRSDAVAYRPAEQPKVNKRGRPKKYGEKVKLMELLKIEILSIMCVNIKGKMQEVEYVMKDLLIRGFAHPVRFLVIKAKIPVILMTTNLNLTAAQMLEIYSARFQIEFCIRDMKQHLGITQYQVRRFEAVKKFLNIAVMIYSLIKIEFFTNSAFQSIVTGKLDLPWRKSVPAFSFEQSLEVIRRETRLLQFFDTYAQTPKQGKIPEKTKGITGSLI